MYRTVRHGENSLQYTILPQQDDLGSGGTSSCAGHSGRRTRKAGGRLKLALVLGVALVLAAGAVTTAVLVPLMIPRPHAVGHRALTRHHHPPQNLLPARRPLHPSSEEPAPPPVAAAHRDPAALFSSTEDPSLLLASSVPSAEDIVASSGLPSEPPATEVLTSTAASPAATSPSTTTTPSTTTVTTTTTTSTTTPAPATPASTAAATASKANGDSTAGSGMVTEIVAHYEGTANDTDSGGAEDAGSDDADVDGAGVIGRGRESAKMETFVGSQWSIRDASAFFEWMGFNGKDSVLLPLALAGVVLVLVIFITACYAIRRHRHKVNRRLAFGKMSNELQSGDKATLLPDGSEDE